MSNRTYDGPPLDGTYQSLSEAPFWNEGETVYATPPEPDGKETTENVPDVDVDPEPDRSGQTTLADWGCGEVDDG